MNDELPAPESLKHLPPCCHGLGWYYDRSGQRCLVVADLSATEDTAWPVIVWRGIGANTYNQSGQYLSGDHHKFDLVYFVGLEKPLHEAYADYYEAQQPQLREYWLVVPTLEQHIMAFQTEERAKRSRGTNGNRVIKVREVVE